MSVPAELRQIVERVSDHLLDDIEQATELVLAEFAKRDDYEAVVRQMVRAGAQELIYAARHQMNCKIKNQKGEYSKPAKVKVGQSESVQKTYVSYYNYVMLGRSIRTITGAEFAHIAETYDRIASGFSWKADLARKLHEIVPEGQTVGQALTEKQLAAVFQEMVPVGSDVEV